MEEEIEILDTGKIGYNFENSVKHLYMGKFDSG